MVRFLTLFLGLLVGPHEVEVMVNTAVAAVELRLDDAAVARLEGEPWRAEVDFGDDLAFRELEAVAFDSDGNELDRTAQAINVPRPQAEVELLLERDESGRPIAVRVEWQSTEFARPEEVHVTLDGERMLELEPHRFGLPQVDTKSFHLVQADVGFPGGARAHAQTSFGGVYFAETSDQLTAVLVSLIGRKRSLGSEEIAGWFSLDGEPLRVVAVEKGPVEVVFVRSEGVASVMSRLDGLGYAGGGTYGGGNFPISPDSARMKTALSLPKHYRLRLMSPRATRVSRGKLSFETFLLSPSLTQDMGVYWALWQRFRISSPTPQPRLSDAVATAGLQAASGKRRRAVVLVTGDETRDFSTIGPEVATDYLRRLAVPLYVWHIGSSAPPEGWPEATPIFQYPELKRAVRSLEKELGRQRVIWLDEKHDPRRIRLVNQDVIARIGAP